MMQLVIENIKKSFGKKEVLKGISFTFDQGHIYGLLGRNGSGKTTLFSIISDVLIKDGGRFFLLDGQKEMELEPADVFFMIAEPTLPSFLTGRELIEFYIEINEKRIKDLKTVDEYFDQIAFEKEDRDRLIQGYSTGMKNKLQMMMFMILRPPVILMDEPLTSLDVVVQLEIKKLIRSIRKDHIILFSTHILQLAEDLCDKIVLLHEGKLHFMDDKLMEDEDFEEILIQQLSKKED